MPAGPRFNGRVRPLPESLCAGALVALAACGGGESAPRQLRLEGIRPHDGQGLYLNEELVLTFDAPVDPASVTSSSLRIVGEDGHRARGSWHVQGRAVRFVPDPVLRPTLDDGGYRPGHEYRLIGTGFPRLDGLRSLNGAPLDRGFRWTFTTVAVGPDQAVVFDDASPGDVQPLLPDARQLDERRGLRVRDGEPLLLTCMEPLDPSTLTGRPFELVEYEVVFELIDGVTVSVQRPRPEAVGLSLALRLNEPQGSRGAAPCCELELHPDRPLRSGTAYDLVQREPLRLTDFHGNPVAWRFSKVAIHVEAEVADLATRRPTLPFLDPAERSPLAVPGTDGLALWEGGRVTVRYPAAAGDGTAGPLAHGHPLGAPDVHTTSVHVPAEQTLSLAPGTGLRVLRAQRGLVVDGALTRRLGDDVVPRGPGEGEAPFAPGETLSAWLDRVGAAGWDWTVVVTGGDLTVTGMIDVDTPLLLVAGGWIRVSGEVRHAPRQLWLMRDGGGASDLTASTPGLVLDPPVVNPLVDALRVAVVSSPVPKVVRPYEWLAVDADGEHRAGSWRVGFLPPTGPVDLEGAVGHPRLLPEAGPLRVVVVLEVPPAAEPGTPWEPPLVDYVDLRWEESD